MMNTGFDREVHFEILEHIGVISTHSTGWNKELNIVRWNGGQPKYDIRDWDLDHEHMSKGITLHEKEMRQIFDLMKKRRMNNRFRKDEPPEEEPPQEPAVEQTPPEEISPEQMLDAACDAEPAEEAAF